MTLCDTGPLVALINRGDKDHERCKDLLAGISLPLITTWPCFTEAMYLVGRVGRAVARQDLWDYVSMGFVIFHEPARAEIPRMAALMEQYQDRPMDLADASLVAAAESLGLRRIFSVDSDFYIYRLNDSTLFDVIPGPA